MDPSRPALVERLADWRVRHGLRVLPSLLAVLGYVAALTPSLLPRPWWGQGVVSGLCALFGYAVGSVLSRLEAWLARLLGFRWSVTPAARRWLLRLRLTVLVLVVVGFPLASLQTQARTAAYVGLPGPGPGFVLASAAVATVLFGALLTLWRGVARLDRALSRRLRRMGRRTLPLWASQALAGTAVVLVLLVVVTQVLVRGVFDVAATAAASKNRTPPTGLVAPTSSLRSGGPGSPESWAGLGQEGDAFVSRGPDAARIAAVTGRPADEPIRAYAGLTDDRSLADVRDAVLRELDRTGAFSRRAILVYTTTGTGWVNEWSAEAFEYLEGGDCAVAAMQYSLLPSPVALFAAGTQPPAAGRLLLDAVAARVAALPADRRPRLYVGGESLGAYGSQAAFSSPDDALARVDGAVWTGTPAFTPLRRQMAASRGRGSTAVDPVVDDGRHLRTAGDPSQLTADQFGRPLGTWATPRLLWVQHPSDPVGWWDPSLLWRTPDWLRETRGDDPTAQMSWLPVVTFWQVTADLANATTVPGGYGHRYTRELVPAWSAVLGTSGVDLGRVAAAIADPAG